MILYLQSHPFWCSFHYACCKETIELKEAEAEAAINWVEAEANDYETVEAEAEAEAVDF